MASYVSNLHPEDAPSDVLNPNIVEENIPDTFIYKSVRSLGKAVIDASEYTDFNDLPLNTILSISQTALVNMQNAPTDASCVAMFITGIGDNVTRGNSIQLVIDAKNDCYYRHLNVSGTFTQWKVVPDPSEVFTIGTSISNTSAYDDLNDLPVNRSYFVGINSGLANMPPLTGDFLVFTLSWTSTQSGHGRLQIAAAGNIVCWRFKSIGGWGSWNSTSGQFAVGTSISNTSAYDDLNDLPVNRSYFVGINSGLANMPPLTGDFLVFTLSWTSTQSGHGRLQIAAAGNIVCWRFKSIGGWGAWSSSANSTPYNMLHQYAGIFMRVGCVGDSLTAGYIATNDSGGHSTYPDRSWVHRMCTITGRRWDNYGTSGATAKSYVTGSNSRLDEVKAAGNMAQAYVIGLGVNDASDPDSLGTPADIGTDADSFYAWYYKLIQEIVGVNSQAFIFCNACPKSDPTIAQFNSAIKTICEYIDSDNIIYVDLYSYYNDNGYLDPTFVGDYYNFHYSSIGYIYMAEMYNRALADVIGNNTNIFKFVNNIPYDEVAHEP